MKTMTRIFFLAAAGLLSACSGQTSTPDGNAVSTPQNTPDSTVTNTVQRNKTVALSPSSKGLIESVTEVPVYSLLSAIVTGVKVKQGQEVRAGQLLYTLDATESRNQISLCQSQIQQAQFQYESIIVGQGYDTAHPAAIPEKIVKAARIRSSLPVYEEQLKIYNQQLEYCNIKAPVSGVVSEVNSHEHDLAKQGVPLCYIIDPEHLRVTFTVLESEISKIQVGATVQVTTLSYPDEVHLAKVTDIKPKVEETGMIVVRAALEDHKNLMPGMTALVTVK